MAALSKQVLRPGFEFHNIDWFQSTSKYCPLSIYSQANFNEFESISMNHASSAQNRTNFRERKKTTTKKLTSFEWCVPNSPNSDIGSNNILLTKSFHIIRRECLENEREIKSAKHSITNICIQLYNPHTSLHLGEATSTTPCRLSLEEEVTS